MPETHPTGTSLAKSRDIDYWPVAIDLGEICLGPYDALTVQYDGDVYVDAYFTRPTVELIAEDLEAHAREMRCPIGIGRVFFDEDDASVIMVTKEDDEFAPLVAIIEPETSFLFGGRYAIGHGWRWERVY